jgi:hypothetical protein
MLVQVEFTKVKMRDPAAKRRRKRLVRYCWLATVLGSQAMVRVAAAQSSQYPVESPTPVPVENLSALDRPVPGYEPIGLQWGSFYAFPRADLSATYDSNVYATPNHDIGDVYFDIQPGIYVVSNWPRHAVSFESSADERVYASRSSEDVTNFHAALAGRLDITNDYLTGGVGYDLGHEDRASPDNVFNQKNPIEYQVGTAWTRYVHEVGLIGFRITGRISDWGYNNGVTIFGVTIPETYRDRIEYSITPQVSYNFYPGYYAFIQAPVNWRVYSDKYDISGFQRSSHGFEVDAGLSVALTGKTFGRAYVGYIDQEYDDPRLQAATGVGFGGDLLWNVTPITSVKLFAARTVEETEPTTVPGAPIPASSILQSAGSAAVEHAFRPNVLGWGRIGIIDQAFVGTIRDDKIYWGQIGVRYLINRFVNVGLDFDYHDRNSNFSIFNYSRELIAARLRVQE